MRGKLSERRKSEMTLSKSRLLERYSRSCLEMKKCNLNSKKQKKKTLFFMYIIYMAKSVKGAPFNVNEHPLTTNSCCMQIVRFLVKIFKVPLI